MPRFGRYQRKKNETLMRKAVRLYQTGDYSIREVARHKDIQKDPMWVWRAIHTYDPNMRKGKKKQS